MKYLSLLFLLAACTAKGPEVESIAVDYYQTYRAHSDFEAFMDFYADSAKLDDVLLGYQMSGKDSIRVFLDWDNPDLKIVDSVALEFDNPVVHGLRTTTTGYFTRFSWQGEQVDSMAFITELDFNEDGKIIFHRDWIDYPREWLR